MPGLNDAAADMRGLVCRIEGMDSDSDSLTAEHDPSEPSGAAHFGFETHRSSMNTASAVHNHMDYSRRFAGM